MPEYQKPRQLRRILLYALIGSILFGAALGLAIILRDRWSWFEIRVMATATTIALASVCGLACDLARSSRRSNVIPLVGLTLTLAAAVMILIGIWPDIDAEAYWKTTGCIVAFAVAAVQVSLLSMARLARKFAWVYFLACQVSFATAAVVSVMIAGEIEARGGMQLLAALSIACAALSLIVPILHRLSKMDEPGEHLASPLGEGNLIAIDDEIDRLMQRIRHLEKIRAELCNAPSDAPSLINARQ